MTDPASYDAWYHTQRGQWIGDLEFSLMLQFLPQGQGQTLLDVGSGSGYFSRRFSGIGFQVTGIDPDPDMIQYARTRSPAEAYIDATALQLPFGDNAFDFCTAVTSLCFLDDPVRAVQEMWRVARKGVILGLLNRHSLLYCAKHGQGGYLGARWDALADARRWWRGLTPVARVNAGSAVWFPGGGPLARSMEGLMPKRPVLGGFLCISLQKTG
jgi:SAM-dependent methyltransferase